MLNPVAGGLDGAINPACVRAYDLRGAVGRELGHDDAYLLGLAYATVARGGNRRNIAVGRDGRESSPELETALVRGLIEGGARVTRTGLGPTPQLYFAVQALGLDGGIMVTGSHNPRDENGFKLLMGGHPIYGQHLHRLVHTKPVRRDGGSDRSQLMHERYIRALASRAGTLRSLKVVWDCGNGAVGAAIGGLTSRLPGTHILINDEVDGRFPAHHPDPSVADNLKQLQATVLETGADLGIAFDGDGDRIGVVDEAGEIVWPDQLLLLLAADQLDRAPGSTIVADVKSSRVLFDGVEQLGGRAVMAPSGYVLVRAQMLTHRAPLAGEMSGHLIFAAAWHGADDALYVALSLLGALSRRRTSLAAFRKHLPLMVSTPELRLACPAARKHAVVREVADRVRSSGARVNCIDGIRVTTRQGWWLLRASGTESKLTARCEAPDEASLSELRHELSSQLAQSGVHHAC